MIYILSLLLLLSSCSFVTKDRGPSSEGYLSDVLENLYLGVQAGVETPTECAERLKEVYNQLLNLRSAEAGVLDLPRLEIEQLIQRSFDTRMEIRERMIVLKNLPQERADVRACVGEIQEVTRALRYVEDYLLEVLHPVAQVEDFDTFQGEGAHFLVREKFRDVFKGPQDLRSGDVLLTRGGAYSSAAIARIGTHDTQFSHLILIYRPPGSKTIQTVEAHIEVGSLILPLQQVMDERHARAMLFRHPNAELAHRAAELMYRRVHQAEQSGKRIPYDFGMDYKNHDKLFCSEVIYEGFSRASGGKLDVPDHKTRFNRKLLPFLQTLGIQVTEQNIDQFKTFAPGDMQFDSQFEVVAEYRHPAKLRDSRLKDAILTMIFRWMADERYQFDPPFGLRTTANMSYLLRRTPLARRFLEDKFPLNMTVDQLKMFLVLDKVAVVMQEHLEAQQRKVDLPMTPLELYSALEKYRQEDLKRFERHQELERELRDWEFYNRGDRGGFSFEERRLRQELERNRPHFHQWLRKL